MDIMTTTWGGLRCRIAGTDLDKGQSGGPVVILMHGFGAPGTDLVPLAQVMRVHERTRFVFPEAPLALGPGFGGGRAWWELDLGLLARRAQGERIARSDEELPGLPDARAAMLAAMAEIQEQLAVEAQQIVLGGFSQGSMLACDVALHSQVPIGGLVLLSSTLIAQRQWEPRLAARRGLPVYQSHGRHDAVLAFEDAERLRDLMASHGLEVTFEAFGGGHEIPREVLTGATAFIRRHTRA